MNNCKLPTFELHIDSPSSSLIKETTQHVLVDLDINELPTQIEHNNKGKEPCRFVEVEETSEDVELVDEDIIGTNIEVLLHKNEFLTDEDGVEESSDEEFVQARQRVENTCFRLFQTSTQVQREAVEGCLGSQ